MEYLSFMILFMVGFYLFMSYGFHYFIMIISLELIMLTFIISFVEFGYFISGMYLFIYVLVIVVCMGGYGLTLVMGFYRFLGSDTFFY